MAGFTNPQAQDVLEHLLGVAQWTYTTTIYGLLGLNTSTPDDTGNIAEWDEPVGGAYARISVNNTAAAWAFTSGATTVESKNANQLEYATATGNWGTVSYFGISLSATTGGGSVVMWGTMSTPKEILIDDQAILAANGITITLG